MTERSAALAPHFIALIALLSACETRKPTPGSSADTKPATATATASAKADDGARCTLDVTKYAPPRRPGRVQVRLSGSGGTVVARDAPALCGPLYDRDWDALDVHAGDGLLFEACLPEGLLQLSAEERSLGNQALHNATGSEGTSFVFNENGGMTYTLRGVAGDRAVLSKEFWRAEVEGTLRDENDARQLKGTVVFDCSEPAQ